jgi:hypothetical protein
MIVGAGPIAPAAQRGWRGLFANGKVLGLTGFASIGGVLYGYNQGVFSQVQVMAEFNHRFNKTVSTTYLYAPILLDLH